MFEIAVDSDGRDLVLLRDWLIANPAVRRTANVRLAAPAPAPGAMGSTAEVIMVAAGTLLNVGSLVMAVASWRQSRRTVASVTIRRGGVEVTLTGTDRAVLDDAARRLEAAGPTGPDSEF